MGFIPTSSNALYDDKVRQQLGGVRDKGDKIKHLFHENEKITNKITSIGFRGDVLDLEIAVAQLQMLSRMKRSS